MINITGDEIIMKIKHWQGYGSVEAKKISKNTKNNITRLHIKVSGNHECGLYRNDKYDLTNWLIRRFDETLKDDFDPYRNITKLDIIEKNNECDYMFEYRNT